MRYFIELAYKGTEFHGWQIQPNALSVQEVVQKGLSTLCRKNIVVTGAGRTDTGVHAMQYFAHFDTKHIDDTEDFTYRLNAILPKSIIIYKTYKVPSKTHARFDAISRSYQYHILLRYDPFLTDITWQTPRKKYNIELMNEAAKLLLKYQNFKAFSKSNTDVKTFNCKIYKAEWVLSNYNLEFHITADRFLRNMVRSIVGTLLEIGENKRSFSSFENLIKSKDRTQAGFSVPAKGLFLSKIQYPKNIIQH